MQTIPKTPLIYTFSQRHPCVHRVSDGETFRVECDDCYGGQVADEHILRPMIDPKRIDGSVGPIFVEGAHPGDTLLVEVLAIELADHGVMMTGRGLGVLGERIETPDTKIIPLRDGFALFSDTIRLPLTPMIGVMGVAPREGLEIHCATPGDHGANLDTTRLCVGARVYLPVAMEGAGLAVGDLHACMGDGELSGTGIETAGCICLRVSVCRGLPLQRPVIEHGDAIYLLASAPTLEEAVHLACTDGTDFLQRKLGLDFPDAYRLMSAACSIEISQVVNPLCTVRLRLPKAALPIDSVK